MMTSQQAELFEIVKMFNAKDLPAYGVSINDEWKVRHDGNEISVSDLYTQLSDMCTKGFLRKEISKIHKHKNGRGKTLYFVLPYGGHGYEDWLKSQVPDALFGFSKTMVLK